MKTKRTTTMHRPTRKNKRMMSGGGKMSKITRRFKDHFKRFIGINDANKIKKCEAWGSLNGIFKFVEAQNTTYANASGKELSGLEKMEENINNTANSSNKNRYIKAIDCFKQGCDTILSGNECVSYSVFVNEGGATTTAVEAPVVSPAAVVTEENASAAVEAPVVSPAAVVTEENASAAVEDPASATVEGEKETSAAVEAPAVEAPAGNTKKEISDVAAQGDEAVVEGDKAVVEADTAVVEADAATVKNADATADSNNEPQQEEEEDTPQATPQATQPATTTASDSDSEQDGGRSRRQSRPSRRIKSRKSKKGRMTRRKHRAVRR
jgi:hypothetical protein